MIPLTVTTHIESGFPQFPIVRLTVGGVFEPNSPPLDSRTAFAGAIVDTGAPYVIVPYSVHAPGWIKIYADLGMFPYRTGSVAGPPLLQRFAEVGLRFFVSGPPPEYRPQVPVVVKAYLLDAGISPTRCVVIGLDLIRTRFPLYADDIRAFLLEPGDSIQLP